MGLPLHGLGSKLMTVLIFSVGMFHKHTTLFVICLCGPDHGLIHTDFFEHLVGCLASTLYLNACRAMTTDRD